MWPCLFNLTRIPSDNGSILVDMWWNWAPYGRYEMCFRTFYFDLESIVLDGWTSGLVLACSASVFVLELAVVSSPPYWLEQTLPGTNFCLSPSLFRVWIRDGARLIKLAASLAKIRLRCRLGWFENTMMYAHYIFVICLFLTQLKLSLLLVLYTMVVLTVVSITSFSDKNRYL